MRKKSSIRCSQPSTTEIGAGYHPMRVATVHSGDEPSTPSTTWHWINTAIGVIAILFALSAFGMSIYNITRSPSDGPMGLQGFPGVDGDNCWDLNGNGVCDVATEDNNLDGVCTNVDCTILVDEVYSVTQASFPCICTSIASASSCSTLLAGKTVHWLRSSDHVLFYCNAAASQWWSVEEYTLRTMQEKKCGTSETYLLNQDCMTDYSALLATKPQQGLYISNHIVITSIVYSDAGGADVQCGPPSSGVGTFNLEVWSSPTSAFGGFSSNSIILAGSTESLEKHDVNIKISGDVFIGIAMANGCGVAQSIDNWGVKIFYRYTDVYP